MEGRVAIRRKTLGLAVVALGMTVFLRGPSARRRRTNSQVKAVLRLQLFGLWNASAGILGADEPLSSASWAASLRGCLDDGAGEREPSGSINIRSWCGGFRNFLGEIGDCRN